MTGRQAPPSRERLDWIAKEREYLYRCRPPEGMWVPILVTPATADDIIPAEEEIKKVVRDLKGGYRVACPSYEWNT